MMPHGWGARAVGAGRGDGGCTRLTLVFVEFDLGLRLKGLLLVVGLMLPELAGAEVCTTQSQMASADKSGLETAGLELAGKVLASDGSGLRADAAPELAKDFAGLGSVVGDLAPKLKGGTLAVDQVYLLDGSTLKAGADGSAPPAEFYCSLNRSVAEVDFVFSALPPGRYGFVIVNVKGAAVPWRLSFLMRQDGTKWMLAGLYPRATMAGGHDGLWYWTQAREMTVRKEAMGAWLYYDEARALLQPADFVRSTHLEKLTTEQTAATPPALSGGVSADVPLVLKGADGTEYRFTALSVEDAPTVDAVDVAAHQKVESLGDPATARKRNTDAMSALVHAFPELRKSFHGMWMVTEVTGQNPFTTEQSMSEIP